MRDAMLIYNLSENGIISIIYAPEISWEIHVTEQDFFRRFADSTPYPVSKMTHE